MEKSLHKQPVKDIAFIDEHQVVSGGLDKTIKQLNFDHEGQLISNPREFKMTLQCRDMKIEGLVRDVEQKKLQEFIGKENSIRSERI
jgi:hypothetical protein